MKKNVLRMVVAFVVYALGLIRAQPLLQPNSAGALLADSVAGAAVDLYGSHDRSRGGRTG